MGENNMTTYHKRMALWVLAGVLALAATFPTPDDVVPEATHIGIVDNAAESINEQQLSAAEKELAEAGIPYAQQSFDAEKELIQEAKIAISSAVPNMYLNGNMKGYSLLPDWGSIIAKNKMTVAKCLAECQKRSGCKSFDVYKKSECFLYKVNSGVGLVKDYRKGAITHYDVCTEFPCYLESEVSWVAPQFKDYMLKDAIAPEVTKTISSAYVCPGEGPAKKKLVYKLLRFDSAAKLKEYKDLQQRAFNAHAHPKLLSAKGGPHAHCTFSSKALGCWLSVWIKAKAQFVVMDHPLAKAKFDKAVSNPACTKCSPTSGACYKSEKELKKL